MEVHKHPHHVTHKKKWTEYLLEFFMLFLAVFLGFVAENIRENKVEHQREKEYIESIIQDLRTDTAKLNFLFKGYDKILIVQDSLMSCFDTLQQYDQNFLRYVDASLTGYPDFIYTDGTIQQLKSGGGFRLIRNRKAVDSIMDYDSQVKIALIVEVAMGEYFQKVILLGKIDFINYHTIYLAQKKTGTTKPGGEIKNIDMLFSQDIIEGDKFFNKIQLYNRKMQIVKSRYKKVYNKAINTLRYLQDEYHLQND